MAYFAALFQSRDVMSCNVNWLSALMTHERPFEHRLLIHQLMGLQATSLSDEEQISLGEAPK